MASSITHFTHAIPGHHLLPMEKAVKFVCGACKELIISRGYKCNLCDFMIDSICATLGGDGGSGVITSFTHPQHGLTLLPERCLQEIGYRYNFAECNICSEAVTGMWYRCAACNFDVHPYCSKLPQFISNAPAHPGDQLRLAAGRPGARCGLCKVELCSRGWNYRCDRCNFDCHLRCHFKSSLGCYETTPGHDQVNTSAQGEDKGKIAWKIALGVFKFAANVAGHAVLGDAVGDALFS